jgi:hypothetical protein
MYSSSRTNNKTKKRYVIDGDIQRIVIARPKEVTNGNPLVGSLGVRRRNDDEAIHSITKYSTTDLIL